MAGQPHNAAFIVGAMLGGLVGAAVTLFRAPQSGAQTRAQLAAGAEALTQRLSQTTGQLGGEVQRAADRVTAPISGLTDRHEAGAPDMTGMVPHPREHLEPAAEVILLPDPLEPDPVVEAAPDAEAASGPAGAGGGGSEADSVVDGPRRADGTG